MGGWDTVRRPGAPLAPGRTLESATVMVVEDDLAVRQTLLELIGGSGYRVVAAHSAEHAIELLNVLAPDLILTDVHMGTLSGIELCQRVKSDPRYELTPVLLLSAVSDVKARVAGLAAGADDFFSKPVDAAELLARLQSLLRVKFLLDQLERAEGVITTLALTIEARDKHTSGHCERLAHYALAVGEALGADRAMLRALRLGGYLHDLGKIAIPDDILLKPGPLDERERERIKIHPAVGADLMAGLKSLEAVRPIVRHHHERWDGSGYPDGLDRERIPLGARIISVVDVFDSLHTSRPYRPALSREAALAIVKRETDAGYWDPAVVTAFLDVIPQLAE